MRRIARRFDRDGTGVEPGGQVAIRHQRSKGIGNMSGETRIEVRREISRQGPDWQEFRHSYRPAPAATIAVPPVAG